MICISDVMCGHMIDIRDVMLNRAHAFVLVTHFTDNLLGRSGVWVEEKNSVVLLFKL